MMGRDMLTIITSVPLDGGEPARAVFVVPPSWADMGDAVLGQLKGDVYVMARLGTAPVPLSVWLAMTQPAAHPVGHAP